jgi:isopenicillin-N epimerase
MAGAGAIAGIAPLPSISRKAAAHAHGPLFGWTAVRAQFALDPSYIHFSAFRFASHPKPVRDAIDRHRRGLDRNTQLYMDDHEFELEQAVLDSGAAYLGARQVDLALTDSTTMGLGILYGGIALRADQEIVATEHDFYPTHEAIRLRAERTGASSRKIRLFADVRTATEAEILDSVRTGVGPSTRVLAITYVHSSTGMKLPVRAIADAVAEINAGRLEDDQIILCVDGVHGIGAEAASVTDLGCDFIAFGSHKWLFGPRGTGVLWGNPSRWPAALATIPTFDGRSLQAWIEGHDPTNLPPAAAMTPGGFHSFEHRWALAEAFDFQSRIGKQRVQDRVHQLATQLKQGLAGLGNVTLFTPMAESLSAGIVCFSVEGYTPREVVDRLLADFRIIASVTPYAFQLARIGTSIVNTPAEVDQAVAAIASLT